MGSASGASGEGPGLAIDERGAGSPSLAEHLHTQIGATTSDSGALFVARWLIDQLDEAGYLRMPLAEVAETLALPLADVERALALVQALDPTGVGARTLGECLALQAREADRYDPLMARLLDNLDLLGRGELARLKRLCGADDEDFAGMLAELRGYDPKPGLRFGGSPVETVTPDILVYPAPQEADRDGKDESGENGAAGPSRSTRPPCRACWSTAAITRRCAARAGARRHGPGWARSWPTPTGWSRRSTSDRKPSSRSPRRS
jgi:RNA polymerase sigma-54 factor